MIMIIAYSKAPIETVLDVDEPGKNMFSSTALTAVRRLADAVKSNVNQLLVEIIIIVIEKLSLNRFNRHRYK
jgi:hypothetical protein